MKIYIKKIDGLSIPKQATEYSSGYDIIATSEPNIIGEKLNNPTVDGYSRVSYIEYETNIYISTEENYHVLIHPRSSIRKTNLYLSNSIGLIDNDYRGQILCCFKYVWQPEDYFMYSNGKLVGNVNVDKIYKKGDAIAQLVVGMSHSIKWISVDELSPTIRGSGGFGSTDSQLYGKILPKSIVTKHSLTEIYSKTGGIPVKEKYTEEVKRQIDIQ